MKKLKAVEKGCLHLTSVSIDKIQVRVTINTVIRNGSNCETMASEGFGTFYDNRETAVCTFKESSGSGEMKTIVKIEPNQVTIQRKGALNMRQQLVAGRKTEGIYLTPYGRMALETKTKTIQFAWDKGKRIGKLQVVYDLWMQRNYTGCYNVTIQMEGVES